MARRVLIFDLGLQITDATSDPEQISKLVGEFMMELRPLLQKHGYWQMRGLSILWEDKEHG